MKKETEKKNEQMERFDHTMRQLMKVSHAELKAALDAEKAAKKLKPKKAEKEKQP